MVGVDLHSIFVGSLTMVARVNLQGRLDALIDLWQELTGVRLTDEQRGEFLTRRETQRLAALPQKRLRRAAATVFARPDHRPGTLMLDAWLHEAEARVSVPQRRPERFPAQSVPFGSRDIHPAPVDRELHRRIGRVQFPDK
jgi:hypothetical protein